MVMSLWTRSTLRSSASCQDSAQHQRGEDEDGDRGE
jgi:hypothetical protein